jgi:hypothetical protein
MIDDADRHDDRMFWLALIAACIAIVWIIYRFPRTSAVIVVALGGAGMLCRLGVV